MENPTKELPVNKMPLGNEDIQMQRELIKKAQEFGVKPEEWVEINAKHFREIITKSPSLVESYKQNPEETLKIIEKLLEESSKD